MVGLDSLGDGRINRLRSPPYEADPFLDLELLFSLPLLPQNQNKYVPTHYVASTDRSFAECLHIAVD